MPQLPATHVKKLQKGMHDLTVLLALAASPVFGVMAWLVASGGATMPLCSSMSGAMPLDSMATMYLLMSLFHLPAWLRAASVCLRGLSSSILKGKLS